MNSYEAVTKAILAQLEQGIVPWHKPYFSLTGARNYVTGRPYSALNRLLLPQAGEYLTPKQAMERKADFAGARTSTIYFFKMVRRNETVTDPETGEEREVHDEFPVLKSYNVLHVSACRGLESRESAPQGGYSGTPDEQAQVLADSFAEDHGISVWEGVYHTPSYDAETRTVRMPVRTQYVSLEAWYADLFRGLALAAAHLLGREEPKDGRERAREELSAMMMSELEMNTADVFDNSAAYIARWHETLGNDDHALVWAASRAEKAARLILGRTEEESKEAAAAA